jgi:hypothetical protein
MQKHRGVLPDVCLGIVSILVAGVAAPQSLPQLDAIPRLEPAPAVDFGTTKETFVSIGEWEFSPVATEQTYSEIGLGGTNLLRYSTASGGGFLAPVRVPDGAVLTSVAFHLCDASGTGQHWGAALLTVANVDGAYETVAPALNSVSNAINPCQTYTQDLSGLNVVVDSQTSRLVAFLVTPATTASNAFAGAIVGYKLQVSPAPGVATFGDVPTNHPFFQYVEALAKSGITGGCGSGNYCPDAPLTRGQMAVFLAKGLGLQWP